jgi:hypothetical protein
VPTGDQAVPHIDGEAFPQALAASAEAVATETDYHGHHALQLGNGLVTVVAVPAASGRLVSFQLGKFEYLQPDPALAKATTDKTVADSGGEAVRVISGVKSGTGPAQAGKPVLLGTVWKGAVTTAKGIYSEVTMTSPADKDSGVQIVRTLRLYAGSTHLAVTDTLTNTGDKPGQWALQSATQLAGLIGTGAPSGQVQLYAPLAPAPNHPQGYWSLAKDGDVSQFQATAQGRLLAAAYSGKAGEMGLGPGATWLAYAESGGNHVLAQRLTVAAGEDYPDGAPGRLGAAAAAQGVAYVEMGVASPWQELKPAATLTLTQDWYATIVPGPIVDVTGEAAISQALQVLPQAQGYQLTGRLGSFSVGTLLITPADAAGQTLGTPVRLPVTPGTALTLNQALSAHAGATTVQLSLENGAGTPLAAVATVPLPRVAG